MLKKVCLIGIFTLLCSGHVYGQGEHSVYALRAAYLYYFSYFIQWPQSTVFSQNQLTLCALVDNEEDLFQLQTIDQKAIGDNQLSVHLYKSFEEVYSELEHCHMLYISEHLSSDVDVQTLASHSNLLLVTEGSASFKGPIHLTVKNKKLRFEIDNKNLKKKSFKVSSKLMRLAM